MDITKLEQEKFSTLKELTEISSNVALGRAELAKLEQDTEKYMVIREEEAEQRVIKVLKESHEALEATTTNHKELSGYNRDLQAYANELTGLSTDIVSLFQDFGVRMDAADESMKVYFDRVKEETNKAKLSKVQIAEDRKQLNRERDQIRDEWRLLRDRQGTLERGFKELKAKKK